MRKTAFALAAILSLSACRQNESELTSGTAVQQQTPSDTAAAALAPPPSCQLQAPRFLPPEKGTADASLKTFLDDLQRAVQTQNTEQLQQLVSQDVRTGFNGSGGWSSFSQQWHPEDPHAELWLLLEHLLRLGGGYPLEDNNSLYALPYVYSNWPDTVDAFAHVAVVNAGAILRKEPAANADAICTLERVILQANYEKSYPQQQKGRQLEWWHVQSADGNTQGYLSHTDVYSPVGYRAILNRNKQGKWQLTALVAGD